MNMIETQIKSLKTLADAMKLDNELGRVKCGDQFVKNRVKIINDAIDTIQTLSIKLAAANMERSSAYHNGEWISVEERMPEEHDSFCARFKGTEKWKPYMYAKQSDKVIVTVEYPDNTVSTAIARTQDGKWFSPAAYHPENGTITHWMSLPEPYRSKEKK